MNVDIASLSAIGAGFATIAGLGLGVRRAQRQDEVEARAEARANEDRIRAEERQAVETRLGIELTHLHDIVDGLRADCATWQARAVDEKNRADEAVRRLNGFTDAILRKRAGLDKHGDGGE